MKKIITTITIILSLHLWYSNADLLIATKELAIGMENVTKFSYVALTLFALSYSVLTAVAVVKIKRYINVLIFALLDGFAVYLRINVDQEHFIFITSVFYAVYTAYIISMCWLLNQQVEKSAVKIPTAKSLKNEDLTAEETEILNSRIRSISGSHRNPDNIRKHLNEEKNPKILAELENRYLEYLKAYPEQKALEL